MAKNPIPTNVKIHKTTMKNLNKMTVVTYRPMTFIESGNNGGSDNFDHIFLDIAAFFTRNQSLRMMRKITKTEKRKRIKTDFW